MGLALLLAFIGVPIIEIAVLIQVGGLIGLWPTIGLVVLSAVVGSMELRRQGLNTLFSLRQQLDRGELPTQTLFDGVCLLFAGALLLTPGFVTDVFGLSLFLAPVRRLLRVTVGRHLAKRMETRVYTAGGPGRGPGGPGGGDGPIDVDYEDVTERDAREETDRDRRID
ncbi:UPF0716 protein FxsA [Limimonas halophila]|uniref:UPF0716 protein FxsA n=1 Tax=Limimonas halophila TaxID=1082479 RepID=A0A1G7SLZ5_9PROT|nr:FxsA family protein [Limimonas halophila]SDG24008.1 UPF0716 protein FxsA [Limimonas halophila]